MCRNVKEVTHIPGTENKRCDQLSRRGRAPTMSIIEEAEAMGVQGVKVVEIDGELYTPPVECGLLAGTFRQKLLEEGKIRERIISVEECRRGSRIFLINSVRKWREAQFLAD